MQSATQVKLPAGLVTGHRQGTFSSSSSTNTPVAWPPDFLRFSQALIAKLLSNGRMNLRGVYPVDELETAHLGILTLRSISTTGRITHWNLGHGMSKIVISLATAPISGFN